MGMYEADKAFEKAVISYGHCEACRYKYGLKCRHIIPKYNTQTRTSFRNAICICESCEKRFIDNPKHFREWLLTTWAKEYLRSEHLKNLLAEDRPEVNWEYREYVCKQVVEDKMGILLARVRDS